ncbi:MAG: hypothetical protein CEN92_231 [Candidatus Berkelbacteria bacterium Licking1014_96]|uniref:Uncharacterized protein n=1 Tax=Candidatus Berkelbacteria bacterium Licking1014_96 TaxID=2017149 RepID=A0A554LFJ2_9BACT|nr:MAG: hypothetical protein CEN92_231 [Candidatus Berkelbacteria bacterium Licking1014_96]
MATATQQQGIFSVHFTGDDGETYSCDWSFWGYAHVWSVSKFNHGVWERPCQPGLTPEAHLAILKRFDFLDCLDQLPIEEVESKGPRALVNLRQLIGSLLGLDEIDKIRSDTLGYKVSADDHID